MTEMLGALFAAILVRHGMAASACTNSADQQIWNATGKSNFDADMEFCNDAGSQDGSGATACVKRQEQYSDDCSACFGAAIHCRGDVLAHCTQECKYVGHEENCKACLDSTCFPDFYTCSGLTPPGFTLPFSCTNDADQKVWTSKGQFNFDADMNACGESSEATNCMKQKEGYSYGCASCFGATIHCTASKCAYECESGVLEPCASESALCKACVATECASDFKTCSGLAPPSWTPPSVTLQLPAANACTNDADQKVWTSKGQSNFDADMYACGNFSRGDEDRAMACMKRKEGYSWCCASCFGATIHCTTSKCMSKCMFGESAACKACVASNCAPHFKTCSGLTPPSFTLQFPASLKSIVV